MLGSVPSLSHRSCLLAKQKRLLAAFPDVCHASESTAIPRRCLALGSSLHFPQKVQVAPGPKSFTLSRPGVGSLVPLPNTLGQVPSKTHRQNLGTVGQAVQDIRPTFSDRTRQPGSDTAYVFYPAAETPSFTDNDGFLFHVRGRTEFCILEIGVEMKLN